MKQSLRLYGLKHLLALMAMAIVMVSVAPAMAQTLPPASPATGEENQCTHFEERKEYIFNGGAQGGGASDQPGLLSEIYLFIKDIVDDTTERLYQTFIDNENYQLAVFAAMTLMVVIFGIAFTIGVAQPSFGQALIRLFRIAIVAAMISPAGWAFFSDPENGAGVVAFFNDGTDDLIKGVTEISTGVQAPEGSTPFYQFDKLAEFLIHPETIVAIMGATFAGGPYGLAMGGLMMFAVAGFVKLLIHALRIYAVSYVARSLLLGVAPIFIVFLLFDKTRQLFMSWINALVSLSLQPILFFTFLSFFLVLIESASKDILGTEFCWTDYTVGGQGSDAHPSFWRPVDKDTNTPITGQFDWKGWWECTVNGNNDCPEFPLNIIDVLTFLLLIYLANRFANVIDRIANELSNAFISLDAGGRLDQFLQNQARSGSISKGANQQVLAAGRPPAPGN
jgi:type IV secretory pathway VirB6-like protein